LKIAPVLVMLDELFAQRKYTNARCTVALRSDARSRVRRAQLSVQLQDVAKQFAQPVASK
jgi:hypothetical protein